MPNAYYSLLTLHNLFLLYKEGADMSFLSERALPKIDITPHSFPPCTCNYGILFVSVFSGIGTLINFKSLSTKPIHFFRKGKPGRQPLVGQDKANNDET